MSDKSLDKVWTKEEIAILKYNADKLTINEVAELLGRTYFATRKKVSVLNIKYPNKFRKPMEESWTAEEIKILKESPGVLNFKEVAEILGYSPSKVRYKANKLGIKYPRYSQGKPFTVWSEEDIQFLRDNASYTSHAEIGGILGKTASAVRTKAFNLGIKGRTVEEYIPRGENHPNWRGGTSFKDHYRGEDWKEVSSAIRHRDNSTCQLCGKYGSIVHHKVPWRFTQDNNFDNLVVLCNRCHSGRPEHFAKTVEEAEAIISTVVWEIGSASPSSQYPGVTWFKAGQKWRAYIHENRKQKHLGYFSTELEAYAAVTGQGLPEFDD